MPYFNSKSNKDDDDLSILDDKNLLSSIDMFNFDKSRSDSSFTDKKNIKNKQQDALEDSSSKRIEFDEDEEDYEDEEDTRITKNMILEKLRKLDQQYDEENFNQFNSFVEENFNSFPSENKQIEKRQVERKQVERNPKPQNVNIERAKEPVRREMPKTSRNNKREETFFEDLSSDDIDYTKINVDDFSERNSKMIVDGKEEYRKSLHDDSMSIANYYSEEAAVNNTKKEAVDTKDEKESEEDFSAIEDYYIQENTENKPLNYADNENKLDFNADEELEDDESSYDNINYTDELTGDVNSFSFVVDTEEKAEDTEIETNKIPNLNDLSPLDFEEDPFKTEILDQEDDPFKTEILDQDDDPFKTEILDQDDEDDFEKDNLQDIDLSDNDFENERVEDEDSNNLIYIEQFFLDKGISILKNETDLIKFISKSNSGEILKIKSKIDGKDVFYLSSTVSKILFAEAFILVNNDKTQDAINILEGICLHSVDSEVSNISILELKKLLDKENNSTKLKEIIDIMYEKEQDLLKIIYSY